MKQYEHRIKGQTNDRMDERTEKGSNEQAYRQKNPTCNQKQLRQNFAVDLRTYVGIFLSICRLLREIHRAELVSMCKLQQDILVNILRNLPYFG